MMPFVPTQRVVCIREMTHWGVVQDRPRRGIVYTVAEICVGREPAELLDPAICLLLAEVSATPYTRAGRTGPPVWEADCFIAVDERRLDVFRRMLIGRARPWGAR